MTSIYKERRDNIQHNFKSSTEIGYWAKKLNIDSNELQKKFVELGFSINKTIAFYQKK